MMFLTVYNIEEAKGEGRMVKKKVLAWVIVVFVVIVGLNLVTGIIRANGLL